MTPIKYLKNPSRIAYQRNLFLLLGICFGFSTLLRLPDLWSGVSAEPWAYTPLQIFDTTVFACGSVWGFWMAILWFRHGTPSENFICLDDQGVTYSEVGTLHHWPWRELSAFELRRPTGSGDGAQKKGTIVFKFFGGPKSSRLERWFRSTKLGAIRWSSKNFDAPIDEIAEKLNDYRDRALGT